MRKTEVALGILLVIAVALFLNQCGTGDRTDEEAVETINPGPDERGPEG